jgi:sulfur-carrier protein adenylyltransferase/sulfurtransferase
MADNYQQLMMNPSRELSDFSYDKAFCRNHGFLTSEEQKKLRSACIAVAGLGGAGGAQALALTRLGIGNFKLADLDVYELSNFNRQMGSSIHSLGKKKTHTTRDQILSINPEASVTLYEEGISASSIDGFMENVDVIMDALDFNCFAERFLLYRKAREKGIWIVMVAPTGFGSSLFVFDPKGMTFEDYFGIHEKMPHFDKYFDFAYGLTPSPFMLRYMDMKAVKLSEGRLPCVSPGFFVTSGVAATEAMKIILNKKPLKAVPWMSQFDAYLYRYASKYYPMGMRSPLQRCKKWIIRKTLNLNAS